MDPMKPGANDRGRVVMYFAHSSNILVWDACNVSHM